MEKNNLIGITLIFILFYVWVQYNAPSQAEMEAMQATQDSIAMVQVRADSIARLGNVTSDPMLVPGADSTTTDSILAVRRNQKFGSFADQANGTEQTAMLENDRFKITFTNRGGRIKQVLVKDYYKLRLTEEKEEVKEELLLLEDEKNRFEYLLPVAGSAGGTVSTNDLFFTPTLNGNTIKFAARGGNGQTIEQSYTIVDSSYNIDYQVNFQGVNAPSVPLNWVNYLDRLERNTSYERNFSSVYFKEADETADYCSCTGDDEETVESKTKWVSHVNQFFNSSLIADTYFGKTTVSTEMLPEDGPDLKKITSKIDIPVNGQPINMKLYVGPNEFNRLAAYDMELEDVIPYGRSIFGTVNRWIIRPLFNVLNGWIASAGLVIFLLTLIIKLVLYPLTYKMLYSQSKTQVLKPKIEAAKAKVGDDPQKQQMETMKLYREYGVNPMGGCFPVLLQMPIWIALYRFFPASIEFRQASFLWATDLSSYDVFAYLPFEIPFYGSHVSMFTLLWAFTTVIYTWYNSKSMDMGAMANNPMMKYMQYLMPVMFLFFFNNFASGLSCYLFFSNVLNIGQNVVTKEVIIDKKKIEKELAEHHKKPKKKGGFQERLSKVLEDQKKLAQEQQKKKGKK